MSSELYDTQHLYDLLPEIYRVRDAERGYPLRDLVHILAREARVVARDIERLHDNSFVETAEPWAVHYLGELLGVRGLRPDRAVSPRAEVANTLSYRRRKGTAAVLEQLARDVTGHPARVVEAFQLLAWSQFIPNHVRIRALATANIRKADTMAWVGGPFDRAAHSVNIGRPQPREGLHNISNIGLFLFRLKSLPQLLTTPSEEDAALGRFRFSPLGADAPLFSHPQAETGPASIAEESHVPVPIRRRALHADLGTGEHPGPNALYVGPGRSIAVWVPEANPADGWRPLDAFYVTANLDPWDRAISPNPGPDNPAVGVVAIDPVLGRLRFEDPTQVPMANGEPNFRLGCYHGFADTLGGGQYDRSPLADVSTIPDDAEHLLPVGAGATFEQLGPALLQAWPADGDRLIEILDSRTYRVSLTEITIPAGRRLVVRAVDRQRPTVILDNPVDIVGGAGSRLEIDGLWISGHGLTVVSPPAGGDGLDGLHLRHTTLVPGHSLQADGSPSHPGAVSLRIETNETETTIEESILGGLRNAPEAQVDLVGSILDVSDPQGSVAYGGLGPDQRFGGPLTVRQCTIFGRIHTAELTLGENSILLGTVIAERRQQGCVRFSWVPLGSRVPRRYRCRPEVPEGASSVEARRLENRQRPFFTSSQYGRPAYAQLHWRAPEVIHRGADNGSEMGVFCRLQWPLREDDLRLRLDEYLPAALEAGIFYAT